LIHKKYSKNYGSVLLSFDKYGSMEIDCFNNLRINSEI
jgi:hypothetical protein